MAGLGRADHLDNFAPDTQRDSLQFFQRFGHLNFSFYRSAAEVHRAATVRERCRRFHYTLEHRCIPSKCSTTFRTRATWGNCRRPP
ncbi:hypothetical protein SBA6_400013 [Candidatus Sulfopaludibacter sp. SbA6]|nr:hypothetical protein SBA6_400013 [Candidatus Sulfopaludibacter sp. SbA6]